MSILMKISLLFAVLIAFVRAAVVVMDDDTFEDKKAQGIWFVKFYAPWCGRMEGAWAELGNEVDSLDIKDVHIGKLDATVHQKARTKYGIRGYPTILLFKDGEVVEKYSGERTVKGFLNFIEKHK